MIQAWILILLALFVLLSLVAIFKPKDNGQEAAIPQDTPSKSKNKNPKVQSYEKWEKRVAKRKGKNAITDKEYVFLSVEDARKLMKHDQSKEDMRVLDLSLDALLDGKDYIKLERSVYEKLKS